MKQSSDFCLKAKQNFPRSSFFLKILNKNISNDKKCNNMVIYQTLLTAISSQSMFTFSNKSFLPVNAAFNCNRNESYPVSH